MAYSKAKSMIGYIKGTIIDSSDKHLVVNAGGGLGYKVFVTEPTLIKLFPGDSFECWTYLVVREQALDLYGFVTKPEKALFELLMNVSGIGPRSALGILSNTSPEVLVQAIQEKNTAYMTKFSGIGKKTAEKIIIELQDKIKTIETNTGNKTGEDVEVLEALVVLGFRESDAKSAIDNIDASLIGTQAKIKEALKILGSTRQG